MSAPVATAPLHWRLERVAPHLSREDRRDFICTALLERSTIVSSLTELTSDEVTRARDALRISDAALLERVTAWELAKAAQQVSLEDLLEVANAYPNLPDGMAEAALEYQRDVQAAAIVPSHAHTKMRDLAPQIGTLLLETPEREIYGRALVAGQWWQSGLVNAQGFDEVLAMLERDHPAAERVELRYPHATDQRGILIAAANQETRVQVVPERISPVSPTPPAKVDPAWAKLVALEFITSELKTKVKRS